MANQKIRPFHVEAYPRLVLSDVLAQVRRGRDHLVWRDQAGLLVGLARLSTIGADGLAIDVQIRSLPYMTHGRTHDEISFVEIRRAGGRLDVFTNCRSCDLQTRSLSLVEDKWFCRTCQELGYRSTIVSKAVREAEKLADVEVRLAVAGVNGLRTAAREQLEQERDWLRSMLGERRARAPRHQRWVLTGAWRPAPVPLVPAGDHEAGDAGERADVLELAGKPLFTGSTLRNIVEGQIRNALKGGYAKLLAEHGRVTQLRMRRFFKSMAVGPIAELDAAFEIETVVADGGVVAVTAIIPFEGEAGSFNTGLPPPLPERMPVGKVRDDDLIIVVRFSRENVALAAVLFEEELELVQQCLERLRHARQEVLDDYHTWVKAAVVEEWNRLKPPRRRTSQS